MLGQPVYTVSKIKEYLQNRKICDVALYNSWIENIPNTSPIVTCITDISRGVGINKISGCGLLAYDMSKDKLIEYSKIASPIAENRSCFSGGVTELLKKKYPVFNIPILDEISEPSSSQQEVIIVYHSSLVDISKIQNRIEYFKEENKKKLLQKKKNQALKQKQEKRFKEKIRKSAEIKKKNKLKIESLYD